VAWYKLRGTQCLALCVYLAESFSSLFDNKCGAMEKAYAYIGIAVIFVTLTFNVYAVDSSKKPEIPV